MSVSDSPISAARCLLPAILLGLLLIALTALALPAPARAAASARDRAATRIYIDANYRLVLAARAHLAASEAAIHSLVRHTVAECPLAGEGSHVDSAASEVSEEVVGTIVTTAYRPDVDSIDTFVHAVAGLHWSDRRLTRIVRAYLVKLRNLAALAPANICADVKAWGADGFEGLPEGTVRFDKLYLAADIEAEEVPLRLLAPYENAHEAALLRRTKRLEAPLANAEAEAVQNWLEIMRGLGLSA